MRLFHPLIMMPLPVGYSTTFPSTIRKNSLEQEPGCRRFDVCFDDDRPQRVLLYEIYDDRAAFDSHRDTAHFEAFNEAVGPLLEARTLDFWTLQPSD